jgi:hypothetical protein
VRRAERQALDSQLSSQAYYAAESGVNDVKYILNTKGSPGIKTDCDPTTYGTETLNPVIDSASGTEYTCLLVDDKVKEEVYNIDTASGSRVIPLKSADGSNFVKFTLSWESAGLTGDDINQCTATSNPKVSAWRCPFGVVRVDLLPESTLATANAAVTTDEGRRLLLGNTFTGFFYPLNSPANSSVSFNGNGTNQYSLNANQGAKIKASCSGTTCTSDITLPGSSNVYYARVSLLYRNTTFSFGGNTSVGQARFKEGQVLIDVTGKSQDVLRRLQVRAPLTGSGNYPEYGLETNQSLCKQFSTFGGQVYNDGLNCP